MSDAAEPDDDAVLMALLTGERSADDADVQALFAARPAVRERFERMQQLAGDLDELGNERDFIAQAAAQPSPFDARTRDMVRDALRPRRRMPWLLLAAAVLVAGMTIFGWSALFGAPTAQRGPDEHSTLGAPQPAPGDLWPKGEVDEYRLFRWNLTLPPGGSYRLRFWAQDPPDTELLVVPDLTASEWSPSPDDLRRMTEAMTWEVERVDIDGRVHPGAGPARVSLR